MSDPDGMGATPTHQADIQQIDTNIWTAEEGSEDALPVPFRVVAPTKVPNQEGLLGVERGAISTRHGQEGHPACSPGSTVPASMPATHRPWSHTTSMRSEDLYPAEHIFVKMLKDSDNLNETPYTTTTSGYPLYKGSYSVLSLSRGIMPPGFHHNCGDQYIPYPIQGPHDNEVKQVEYVQTIMGPNPLVIGLRDDSDKVFSKLLYVTPIYNIQL